MSTLYPVSVSLDDMCRLITSAILLEEIEAIEKSEPDINEDGVVAVDKLKRLGEALARFRKYQQVLRFIYHLIINI